MYYARIKRPGKEIRQSLEPPQMQVGQWLAKVKAAPFGIGIGPSREGDGSLDQPHPDSLDFIDRAAEPKAPLSPPLTAFRRFRMLHRTFASTACASIVSGASSASVSARLGRIESTRI
jgi:hypothetical protein